MTPRALFNGARMAVSLARRCERSADDFDLDWHQKMIASAKEHRIRAAYYLRSRRWMLNDRLKAEQEAERNAERSVAA